MRLRLVSVVSIGMLLFLHHPAATSVVNSTMNSVTETEQTQNDKRQEAQRLWELVIAAKGGRERLFAVRNMVISSRGEYASSALRKNHVRREELLVFPHKYWFWDDYRPDVFGLSVSMYDYDNNISYLITDSDPYHPPEPMANRQRNKALRNDQLSFLLETRWFKPSLVNASTGKVGMRAVDILQTIVDGERVDFFFDQQTHLPARISYYDVFNGKTYSNTQSFSDYTKVNGIGVPQTIVYDDGSKYKSSFQFNVEYNENIFVRPPPIEAGPEAWRPKK